MTMTRGMLVRFSNPLNDGEAADIMEVIEDRDTRVLVRSMVYMVDATIRPTAVYAKADLTAA